MIGAEIGCVIGLIDGWKVAGLSWEGWLVIGLDAYNASTIFLSIE